MLTTCCPCQPSSCVSTVCLPLPAPIACAQITHRISWEEPILPERVEIDDEGGYILTEAGACVGGVEAKHGP